MLEKVGKKPLKGLQIILIDYYLLLFLFFITSKYEQNKNTEIKNANSLYLSMCLFFNYTASGTTNNITDISKRVACQVVYFCITSEAINNQTIVS